MALHDQWNIATDDSFKRRVEGAAFSTIPEDNIDLSHNWRGRA
jgi:hypothetical protein